MRLMPFIPEYIPAIGGTDEFIKVPRPDGQPDYLGLKVWSGDGGGSASKKQRGPFCRKGLVLVSGCMSVGCFSSKGSCQWPTAWPQGYEWEEFGT